MTTPKPVSALTELRSSNPFLSEDEKEALEAQKKALDALLTTEGLAKYKLELLLGKDFSMSKPCTGALSFWESGSKLHGGGDTILYVCPGKAKGVSSCEAFIPDDSQGYGFLVCHKCGTTWKGEEVSGQILARLPVAGWGQLLTKYFHRLEQKADIVLKYHPLDIRSAAASEQEKQQMGDRLMGTRNKRHVRIYTLASLLTDTTAGAEIEARILAFIKA